ncbi:MAG: hypothetical protein LBQ27_04220 [Clostridiales bacterium]|jgi:CBS domain containing-hemolysin-like protein|nr:hypothetical protein [Clostridiales bacterium]
MDDDKKQADKRIKKSETSKKNSKKKKSFFYSWTFKVIIVSFFLTAFFTLLSEMTVSMNNIALIAVIILFIIAVGIIFDVVGVAVTSCELGPLTAMASRKVKAAKTAIMLVNNAEKVANFCGDVIGDIFGIISGACIVALAAKAATGIGADERILMIILSSVTAAATIGGKSYGKGVAIKRSKDFVMLAAKVICFFKKEK